MDTTTMRLLVDRGPRRAGDTVRVRAGLAERFRAAGIAEDTDGPGTQDASRLEPNPRRRRARQGG